MNEADAAKMQDAFARLLMLLPERDRASLGDLLKPAFIGLPEVDDVQRMGYVKPFRCFPDGRVCAIMPMSSIDVLCVGIHPWGHANAYYYRAGGTAAAALEAWDGQGEPAGWWRNPSTGRRRTNGDPAQGYYQP
jgi:hypothetical protein